jgi:hypothetical protein
VGGSKGKRLLRARQFQFALQGNVSMLIWLGRCILGQIPDASVQLQVDNDDVENLQLSEAAKAHLMELAVAIQKIALAANRQDLEAQAQLTDGNGNG